MATLLPLQARDYIARMVQTEADHRLAQSQPDVYAAQVRGIVQVAMNRLKSNAFPNTIVGVLNQRNQFSKINGPSSQDPYGSIQNAPKADARVTTLVNDTLRRISRGEVMSVGDAVHFGVVGLSDASNRAAVAALPLKIGTVRFGNRDGAFTPNPDASLTKAPVPVARAYMPDRGGGNAALDSLTQAFDFTPYATVRTQPVTSQVQLQIQRAVQAVDPGLRVKVVSGGQPTVGENRVGSTRHDGGRAADFKLTRGGKELPFTGNEVLYNSVVRALSAQGVKGIGLDEQGSFIHSGGPRAGDPYSEQTVWGYGSGGGKAEYLSDSTRRAALEGQRYAESGGSTKLKDLAQAFIPRPHARIRRNSGSNQPPAPAPVSKRNATIRRHDPGFNPDPLPVSQAAAKRDATLRRHDPGFEPPEKADARIVKIQKLNKSKKLSAKLMSKGIKRDGAITPDVTLQATDAAQNWLPSADEILQNVQALGSQAGEMAQQAAAAAQSPLGGLAIKAATIMNDFKLAGERFANIGDSFNAIDSGETLDSAINNLFLGTTGKTNREFARVTGRSERSINTYREHLKQGLVGGRQALPTAGQKARLRAKQRARRRGSHYS